MALKSITSIQYLLGMAIIVVSHSAEAHWRDMFKRVIFGKEIVLLKAKRIEIKGVTMGALQHSVDCNILGVGTPRFIVNRPVYDMVTLDVSRFPGKNRFFSDMLMELHTGKVVLHGAHAMHGVVEKVAIPTATHYVVTSYSDPKSWRSWFWGKEKNSKMSIIDYRV